MQDFAGDFLEARQNTRVSREATHSQLPQLARHLIPKRPKQIPGLGQVFFLIAFTRAGSLGSRIARSFRLAPQQLSLQTRPATHSRQVLRKPRQACRDGCIPLSLLEAYAAVDETLFLCFGEVGFELGKGGAVGFGGGLEGSVRGIVRGPVEQETCL